MKNIRAKKYFIHINNTNPALNERGPEHAALREAGWELAHDGLELEL
jgi:pyrroloquinoline quinone biosynthesis protein B